MRWCHSLTFTIFNPFHPRNLTDKGLRIAEDIALALKATFAPETFQQTEPEFAHRLPRQVDCFNCGSFIIIYTLKVIFESSGRPNIS